MNENTETLHKLCKALLEELEDYSKKIEKEDGMSAGDLAAVDTLSHALKSVKTTIAMMEAEDGEGGYSGRFVPRYYPGMSWASDGRGGNQGGSRGGMSYAGQRRDSMGRYSREGGYSYAAELDGVMDDLRGLMADMPSEKQRTIERLMDEIRR